MKLIKILYIKEKSYQRLKQHRDRESASRQECRSRFSDQQDQRWEL